MRHEEDEDRAFQELFGTGPLGKADAPPLPEQMRSRRRATDELPAAAASVPSEPEPQPEPPAEVEPVDEAPPAAEPAPAPVAPAPRAKASGSLPPSKRRGAARKATAAATPAARAVKARRPGRRKPGAGVRVLSIEASTALHLAVLILLLSLPQAQPAKAEKPEVIPIEVSFVAQPMLPQKNVAPPGPKVKPVPEPMPAAPEAPAPKPQRQQAAAPKPLPPKPRVNPNKPAPKPQQKEPVKPKAPDLQAMLNARMNAGQPSEEQRLAALRDKARTGSQTTTSEPASGLPMGDPKTSGSGLSGALASRAIAYRVNPAYPDQAQRLGDEGQVVVRIWVTASGAVSKTEIVRSSGRGYFDRAAVTAMRQWRFNPMPDPEGGEQYGDITLYFTL